MRAEIFIGVRGKYDSAAESFIGAYGRMTQPSRLVSSVLLALNLNKYKPK